MAKTSFVPNPARIKVIGLGGGGCNAITRMIQEEIQGVDFIGVNTDAQALLLTEAPTRIQIGEKMTRGLGVGGDHTLGRKAAEQSRDELRESVRGADMVCLLEKVDTLIVIPNDRLLTLCDNKTAMANAFKMADDVLRHAVQAIAEVITVPGVINLDFADVKAVMLDAGPAWMSIGHGTGQNRAIDAAKAALASPLLDVSVAGAKGVLFNVCGGSFAVLHSEGEP